MDKKLLDNTKRYLFEFMDATKKEVKNIQADPIGRESRSKRDYSIIFRDLLNLPKEERQTKMQEIANLAGHKGAKFDDCEMCEFLRKNVGDK